LWEDPDVDGLKTGYVRVSGFHVVVTAKRGDKHLMAVVMGAKNKQIRSRQTKKMLDYGFQQLANKHHDSMIRASIIPESRQLSFAVINLKATATQ
jgi:D-alanyl-D-alanine carboxypeptidase